MRVTQILYSSKFVDELRELPKILALLAVKKEKKPILPKHIYSIGIQHPEEQSSAPIVGLGSVQHGDVLYLFGVSDWRFLRLNTVQSNWSRRALVCFLSE